eukprot:tig00000789_g4122.t1
MYGGDRYAASSYGQQPGYGQSYGQPGPGYASGADGYGGPSRASQLSSSMRPAPGPNDGPLYVPRASFPSVKPEALKSLWNITSWARLFLIGLNAASIVVGIILIALGAYAMNSGGSAIIIEIVGKAAFSASIAAGTILLLLSLIGFFSAKNTSRLGLLAYGLLLITVIPLLFTISSIAFGLRATTDEVDGFAPLLDPFLKQLVKGSPERACTAYRALGCSGGTLSCAQMGFEADFCPPGCPSAQDVFAERPCYGTIVPPLMKACLWTGILTGLYGILLCLALGLAVCTCCHNAQDDGESGPAATLSAGIFGLLGFDKAAAAASTRPPAAPYAPSLPGGPSAPSAPMSSFGGAQAPPLQQPGYYAGQQSRGYQRM